MSQYQGYNFCPNCGAVTKEGVCTACGHKSKGAVFNKPAEPAAKSDTTVFDYTQTGVTTSFAGGRAVLNGGGTGKKGNSALVLAIVSFALIVAFVGIIYAYFNIRFTSGENTAAKVSVSAEPQASVSASEATPETESDVITDGEPGDFKAMVLNNFAFSYLEEEEAVAEEDAYDYTDVTYYVYDDYIRTDLDYKILNTAWEYNGYNASAYGVNAPENVYIYCTYPQIMEAPELEEVINDAILERTMYICSMYDADCEYLSEDQVYYGDEHVYITYMDENVLSLLFYYDGYFASDSEEKPRLVSSTVDTLNYDMKTGKELKMPGITISDDVFLEKFIKEVDAQNQSDILADVSKADLLLDYKSGNFKWFYNPFGVEIAYCVPQNYGFYSCTMDPDEIFEK